MAELESEEKLDGINASDNEAKSFVKEIDQELPQDGEKNRKDSIEKPKALKGQGIARIKEEFIDHNHKRQVAEKYLPKGAVDEIKTIAKFSKSALQEEKTVKPDLENNTETAAKNEESSSEPPAKKQKLKGRNKKRPKDKRPANKDKLCPAIVASVECSFAERCRFCHDIQAYIDRKPKSAGGKCYLYETFGKCWFGVGCMFYEKHTLLGDGYKQVVNEEKVNSLKDIVQNTNTLSKKAQTQLWKRKYDFTLAHKALKTVLNTKLDEVVKYEEDLCAQRPAFYAVHDQNVKQPESKLVLESEADTDTKLNSDTDSKIACDSVNCVDAVKQELKDETESKISGENEVTSSSQVENEAEVQENKKTCELDIETEHGVIKLRPQEKKKIDFRDKLYLAPLTTVGNLPFRRICKQFGADITCSEMATGLGLLQGHRSEWALLRRHHTEDLFGAQVCGAYPDILTKTAQAVMENTDVDFMDINCGCPIDLFYRKGEGCGLMAKTTKLYSMVRSMQGVMNVPLTVKMRTGINEGKNIADRLMVTLRDLGVSMVTLHGRSREQRYTRLADWQYIQHCTQHAAPMPVFGNGDILSFEDYNLNREQTKVAGCMIARGALMKPWIFTEIKEQRHWDISSKERLDMLKDFTNYGLENWGTDIQGVQTTRRFLLEWLSFLYRYIPVGVLEQVPQKINEKPPHYIGRDDLETLMASPNCADWIRISEMLLGPVQDDFQFLPKHKANSFQ